MEKEGDLEADFSFKKCGLCGKRTRPGMARSYCSACAAFLGICPSCGGPGEQNPRGGRYCPVCRKRIRYQGKNVRIEGVNGRLGKGENDGEQDGVSGIEGGTGNRGNDQGDRGGAVVFA